MNLRAPRSVGLCQRSRRLKGCNVKAREHIISSWQDSEHNCSAHSIQAYVRASRSHDCCVDETLSAASKAAGAWIVSPWHACPECSFCCCDIPLPTSSDLLFIVDLTSGYPVVQYPQGVSMIDHEKLQKGRAWGYVAGIVLVLMLVAWKFISH